MLSIVYLTDVRRFTAELRTRKQFSGIDPALACVFPNQAPSHIVLHSKLLVIYSVIFDMDAAATVFTLFNQPAARCVMIRT